MRNLRKESLSSKECENIFLVFKPDLNLEHIITVDAANHLTGISSSTSSISARQRLGESHFSCMSVISNLFTQLNMITIFFFIKTK